MRYTCDGEIKPSEIDRAFSSSRYCLLAPARLDAFDLLSKKWIKVETTSLISKDPSWNTIGNRFKAYQRPQPGEHEPSEWMVMVFSLRKLLRPATDFVVRLFRSSDPGRKEPDGV